MLSWKLLFAGNQREKIKEIHKTVDAYQLDISRDILKATEYRLNGDLEAAVLLIASCQERNELCSTLLDSIEAI